MKLSSLFYVVLICTLIASQSTQCNGLMRKLNSESQLSLTCRKTTEFGFCAYTLGADPRSAGKDVNGLAHIALDKLVAYVKDTLRYLQGLQGNVFGKEAQAVRTCIQLYSATAEGAQTATASLNSKAYARAKQAAVAVKNNGQRCQQRVNQNPSPKTKVLTAKNKFTHDLSQLSNDLIGLLG